LIDRQFDTLQFLFFGQVGARKMRNKLNY